jgi:hypothetical protein
LKSTCFTELGNIIEYDVEILKGILAVLEDIGSQLEAADRIRGYDPWTGITLLERDIEDRTMLLSDDFCEVHSDLVKCLSHPVNLH